MTLQEELKWYKQALEDFSKKDFRNNTLDRDNYYSICFYLYWNTWSTFELSIHNINEKFPTMVYYRRNIQKKKSIGYWWDKKNKESRIKFLKSLIEYIEKELSKSAQ